MVLIPAVLVYVIIANNKQPGSRSDVPGRLEVHALPVLAGWFWYHAQATGWLTSPDHPNVSPFNLVAAYLPPRLIARVGTVVRLVAVTWHYFGRTSWTGVLVLLIVAYTLSASDFVLALHRRMPWRAAIRKASLHTLLRRWQPTHYLVLLALPIVIQLVFMASTDQLFRYLLPAYPGFFVLVARAIRGVFPRVRSTLGVTGGIIVMFAVGATQPWFGYELWPPSSFRYVDFVQSHEQAAAFIEANYPAKTMLAGWPE